jgi:hypothetical protein
MRRSFIILLTLITAGIHFYFFYTDPKGGLLFIMFLLNGLGYLGLLGLLYLPLGLPASLHRLVRPVFIGYTILTIVLYIIISAQLGIWSFPWAPIAKVAEVILVWQLWSEGKTQMSIAASRKSDAML